jgi:hypothetical protein
MSPIGFTRELRSPFTRMPARSPPPAASAARGGRSSGTGAARAIKMLAELAPSPAIKPSDKQSHGCHADPHTGDPVTSEFRRSQ